MFFVNEAHRKNYESLLDFYKNSLPSIEYEVACYVLAMPEVLKRIPDDQDVRYPFDWAWRYNDEEEKVQTDALFYMEDGYKQLVIAANHMYNGQAFRLNSGLEYWSKEQFSVFIQACKIRGKFQ